MNQVMTSESLHGLQTLPNVVRNSNRERSDKKQYGKHGNI